MSRVAKSSDELIGWTPIVRLSRIDKEYPFEVWAKAEFLNPTGSVKDRMALYMIKEAERKGRLKPGMTIVVPTTGNTGISFSAWGSYFGYKVLIVMPEEMSFERKLLDTLFGAELTYTPGGESDAGKALDYARKLEREHPDKYVLLDQWDDEANVRAHYETTGREIVEQLGAHTIKAFVAGVGSGGTLAGVAKRLKEANPGIVVAGMEPAECPTAEGWFKTGAPGPWGRHEVEGIGDGFVPKIISRYRRYIDEWVTVSSEEAIKMARRIAREEGLPIGISSGANVAAAIKLGQRLGLEEGRVVTVLPDNALRYFSTRLFLRSRLSLEDHKRILELAKTQG